MNFDNECDIIDTVKDRNNNLFSKQNTLLFDSKSLIRTEMSSYNFSTAGVWSQFELDSKRIKLVVNNKKVGAKKQFVKILKDLIGVVINIDDVYYNLIDVVAALVNQNIFACVFVLLVKEQNYVNSRLMPIQQKSNRGVRVEYNKKMKVLTVVAETDFGLLDPRTEKVVSSVFTSLAVNILIEDKLAKPSKHVVLITDPLTR